MWRGPRTILGLAAGPKWPTPCGRAMSVACGAGPDGDDGPVGGIGPVGDIGPVGAAGVVDEGSPSDVAAVVAGAETSAWGLMAAVPPSSLPAGPPKTVQAPRAATASAARAAITTSHLRTFQSLRRRRFLAGTDSRFTVDGGPDRQLLIDPGRLGVVPATMANWPRSCSIGHGKRKGTRLRGSDQRSASDRWPTGDRRPVADRRPGAKAALPVEAAWPVEVAPPLDAAPPVERVPVG